MDADYENNRAEFEAARNDAMDRYFGARPQLMRTGEQESLFEAGFRMAHECCEIPPHEQLHILDVLWMLLREVEEHTDPAKDVQNALDVEWAYAILHRIRYTTSRPRWAQDMPANA